MITMSLNKRATAERIKEKLLEVYPQKETRPGWSGLVKTAFIQLAEKQGYKVCTALSEEAKLTLTDDERKCVEWGEWLYDLVWYAYEKDDETGVEHTTSVPLVMECEWNISLKDIATDFDKLLVANADLRVMVCGWYDPGEPDAIITYCERAVQSFEQGRYGDQFLICILPEADEGKPRFHTIIKE
jgi:hypothetical protein